MAMARTAKPGCLILFSLPCAAVGVAATIWVATAVLDYWRMKSWVEVPATIKRVELKEDDDADGATYEVVADYEYEFNRQHFTGTRVAVQRISDNIGRFQRRAYGELKQHLDQQ